MRKMPSGSCASHNERKRSSLSASILCAAADESLPQCARTPNGRRAVSIAATAHARDDLALREADAQHQREKAELVDEARSAAARAAREAAANSMGRVAAAAAAHAARDEALRALDEERGLRDAEVADARKAVVERAKSQFADVSAPRGIKILRSC